MGKKQSRFTDEIWDTLIGPTYRDNRALTGKEMARALGIHEVTLTSQMRRRGFYRNTPQAEAPPQMLDLAARPTTADRFGIVLDWDRLEDSQKQAMELAATLAAGGHLVDCILMMRVVREIGRHIAKPTGVSVKADNDNELRERFALLAPPQELTLSVNQTPPAGLSDGSDWMTWLFLGGRGAGKTLAGACWLAEQAERLGRVALVGATLHDVREVMINGPSGIMALPRWKAAGEWPVYEPSRRRVTFPNGGVAYAFSAEDPDSLRGPQFAAAWADEFCAWAKPEETLAMLRLGLRLGERPQLVVTTTPRPMRALRALKAEASCAVTHATTMMNAENLSPGFVAGLTALYGGTRREAQELEGVILDDEGGLFRAEDVAGARTLAKEIESDLFPGGYRPSACLSPQTPGFDRIVVAVDPAATAGGDACGIVAVGRLGERAHVLADRSKRGLSPDGWARRALALMDEVGAGAIVAEVNQGGDMVAQTLKTIRPEVNVVEVRATRGKRMRAEPVAALYEQGRVAHHGGLRELEEELMALGGPDDGRLSLDRADALVWGLTELMIREWDGPPRFTQF